MLIEFRTKNFMSIKDELILSLVAGGSKELRETNVVNLGIHGTPPLLRSAALFGPNASGKSNIILAIQFMADFVTNSASRSKPSQPIPVLPFLLDKGSSSETTEFEVVFVHQRTRYQYGFIIDVEKVHDEWLFAAPEHKRTQTWYERTHDDSRNSYEWKFGQNLKGQKQSIQSSTRDNALFLSTAASLNNSQLQVVWQWFADNLRAFSGQRPMDEGYTTKLCREKESSRNRVVQFLRNASINLADIKLKDNPPKRNKPAVELFPELASESDNVDDSWESDTYFTHEIEDGLSVDFPLALESAGTRFLFAWAGPLLDTLDRGLVLAVDELDSSLHTLLAQYVIGLFHDPEVNSNNAQLIFTTHSTPIMGNKSLLRRDQVWFVSKDRLQGSQLHAFIEFQPRKGEDRERNYLRGRYGAIPALPNKLRRPH